MIDFVPLFGLRETSGNDDWGGDEVEDGNDEVGGESVGLGSGGESSRLTSAGCFDSDGIGTSSVGVGPVGALGETCGS